MNYFALSDLHLSMSGDKPMDCFGEIWHRHWEKIQRAWEARVGPEDVVLMPGDHSWGMRLEDAQPDLAWIQALPGRKILTRGNHDYWWQSLGKIRKAWPAMTFLQNDSVLSGRIGICGTRGWALPGSEGFQEAHDEKIFRREVERLKLALESIPRQAERRVVMLHYPPLLPYARDTEFTRLLERFEVDLCVFGHLHGHQRNQPVQETRNGVRYLLVSCDAVDFAPVPLDLDLEPGARQGQTQAEDRPRVPARP